MASKKKIWMFVVLAIVNLIVILSFIILVKKIRNDDKLKINSIEIPAFGGDFLI